MKTEYSLLEIQSNIEGSELQNCNNPENVIIDCVVTLDDDKQNSISFVRSRAFVEQGKISKATIIIVNKQLAKEFERPVLVVKNVEESLIPVLSLFHSPKSPNGTISEKSSIHETATIGENSEIGDFVIVGENSNIGKNCIIEGNVSIGKNVSIGDDSRVGPGNVIHDDVTIGDRFVSFGNCTIGADGFRFVFTPKGHLKIPQIGKVILGNDIEIGAQCTIDKGGLGDTILGDGCKFDNMVHIAHNCILKNNIVIAAQSGIAGSSIIGNNVMISGHCAIQDHIELADGTIIAGKTGVRKSITKAGIYVGEHAQTLTKFNMLRKNISHLVRFDKWMKRIEKVEEKLGISKDEEK